MDDVTIVFNIYVHNLNGMTLNVKYDCLLFYVCVSNESKLRMKSQPPFQLLTFILCDLLAYLLCSLSFLVS